MKKAFAHITGNDGNTKGTINFTQEGNGKTHLLATGTLYGFTAGDHGLAVHTYQNNLIGPHFNPDEKQHGAPEDGNRHAGDLGNIRVGSNGEAPLNIYNDQLPLSGQNSIIGKAIVIHEKADDLGKGENAQSKIDGNAGPVIAYGVIVMQDP